MVNRKESKPALPPLGLGYIAGLLRANGVDVEIYDMLAEGYYDEHIKGDYIVYGHGSLHLIEKLKRFKPTHVGVSCMMSLRHYEACSVIRWVKTFDQDIITVIGGCHPSSMPELVLEECGEYLDYLVIGEGELAMMDIQQGTVNAEDKIVYGKSLPVFDTLPFPAHDLLPLNLYKKIWEETSYHFYEAKKYVIMNTSRGCVNSCEHCPHEIVFGKGWRGRRLKRLIEEVKWVVEELGVEEIQFHEYNGQVNKKFMKELAIALKPFNIRWGFPIGVWVKLLDKELLELMYDSGMDYINLAIESPKSDVLKTMPGKDVDLNYVEQVIKWCREIGYYINGFFMIGYPNQTLEDMWDTVIYSRSLDINTVAIFIAQPLPGTVLWERVKFIDDFHPFMLRYGKCNTKSDLWTPEQVEHIRHEGRRMFIESKKGKLRGGNFRI